MAAFRCDDCANTPSLKRVDNKEHSCGSAPSTATGYRKYRTFDSDRARSLPVHRETCSKASRIQALEAQVAVLSEFLKLGNAPALASQGRHSIGTTNTSNNSVTFDNSTEIVINLFDDTKEYKGVFCTTQQ